MHGDFIVETKINVFQDAKGMLEHKVLARFGPGQGTEAMIVQPVLSQSPAGQHVEGQPEACA